MEIVHIIHTAYEIGSRVAKEFRRADNRTKYYSYNAVKGVDLLVQAIFAGINETVDLPNYDWLLLMCGMCKKYDG
jgi:hypothetical protein